MPAVQLLLPDTLEPDGLLERLAARLRVEAEPAQAADRTFLDTFDGRLHRAGLVLAHERGRLELSTAAGEPVAAEAVGRAPRAVLVTDLPDGRLRDALDGVLDVRAATRVARVRVREQALRVLDRERKTVARLTLVAASGLRPRVVVAGVRGYDKALARVRRVLEDELRLAEAGRSLAEEAVVAAGGVPGGVSSKLDVALEPDERADAAAVTIAARLLGTIEANLPGTLADVDAEFLHDLRVAVRRTRALQRELKRVFPPGPLAEARAEFRRLQQVTGPVRDLDVQLEEFDAVAGDQRADLEPLRGLLAERRRRERARMVRELKDPRTRETLDRWRALLDALEDLPPDDRPDAARTIHEVAGERIRRVYRQMVKMGEAIGPDSPHEALHDLRKKGKELRYLLEFFSRLFDPDTVGPMVKTLKALQDVLGRFQDREVQADILRGLGDDVGRLEDGPAALMAMGVLIVRLQRQQEDARAEFAARFGPFEAEPQQKAVKAVFR